MYLHIMCIGIVDISIFYTVSQTLNSLPLTTHQTILKTPTQLKHVPEHVNSMCMNMWTLGQTIASQLNNYSLPSRQV
jgi:hypothetical protein